MQNNMVTRSKAFTEAQVLILKLDNSTEVRNLTFRGKKSEKEILKAGTAEEMIVRVLSLKTEDRLYGMTEDTFFEHAKPLDDKRKFIEE